MNIWLKTALALAVLWACALGGIHWLRASKPTVASVTDAFAHANLGAKSPADRDRTLHGIEDGLNDLTFDERQRLQRSGATRQFFLSLTPAEQSAFLDATLPTDFRQLMEAFNKMDPAKRKQFVTHAVEEMRKHEGEERPHNDLDEKVGQRVTDEGLKAFYSDADAGTKLDLAPLIEQMQRNLQMGGG